MKKLIILSCILLMAVGCSSLQFSSSDKAKAVRKPDDEDIIIHSLLGIFKTEYSVKVPSSIKSPVFGVIVFHEGSLVLFPSRLGMDNPCYLLVCPERYNGSSEWDVSLYVVDLNQVAYDDSIPDSNKVIFSTDSKRANSMLFTSFYIDKAVFNPLDFASNILTEVNRESTSKVYPLIYITGAPFCPDDSHYAAPDSSTTIADFIKAKSRTDTLLFVCAEDRNSIIKFAENLNEEVAEKLGTKELKTFPSLTPRAENTSDTDEGTDPFEF